MDRIQLKSLLAVARGDKEIDLLIKNVKVLDLVNGVIFDTAIAISDGHIAGVDSEYSNSKAKEIWDAGGMIAVPGFIDAHLHVESSMMHPFEFEKITLPLGTTTAICDPHEITNVLGANGFSWFLRCSELVSQNLFLQVSSCVPALPGFETNAGEFYLSSMEKFKEHPNVIGLAEVMNFPGVINGDNSILEKLDSFRGMNIDGHCPLLRGRELNAYIAAGIKNCHETIFVEEAKEKLRKGMAVIIREGTVAKNLKNLASIITEFNSLQCMLCTDDRNPYDILKEGHINYMIRELINSAGVSPHIAYRVASYSAAKNMGLENLGLIAPGKQADIVMLSNLEKVKIEDVLIKGRRVSGMDFSYDEKLKKSNPPMANTIKRKQLVAADFGLKISEGVCNVIGVIEGEIITKNLKINYDGQKFNEDDVLKIAVIERYGHNSPVSVGLVNGMGALKGAIASSVAHDSHNIIVVGVNDVDMAKAANSLIESQGGFCVVADGELKSILKLPLAGLISMDNAETIRDSIDNLKTSYMEAGGVLDEPFLQMAFLALPVIPFLKITDKGLFDVDNFKFCKLQD